MRQAQEIEYRSLDDIYFPYNEGTVMLNLPVEFMSLMLPFVHLFSKRTFKSVQVLVVGAILAPGKRTINGICFQAIFHQVQQYTATTENGSAKEFGKN